MRTVLEKFQATKYEICLDAEHLHQDNFTSISSSAKNISCTSPKGISCFTTYLAEEKGTAPTLFCSYTTLVRLHERQCRPSVVLMNCFLRRNDQKWSLPVMVLIISIPSVVIAANRAELVQHSCCQWAKQELSLLQVGWSSFTTLFWDWKCLPRAPCVCWQGYKDLGLQLVCLWPAWPSMNQARKYIHPAGITRAEQPVPSPGPHQARSDFICQDTITAEASLLNLHSLGYLPSNNHPFYKSLKFTFLKNIMNCKQKQQPTFHLKLALLSPNLQKIQVLPNSIFMIAFPVNCFILTRLFPVWNYLCEKPL